LFWQDFVGAVLADSHEKVGNHLYPSSMKITKSLHPMLKEWEREGR